MSIKRFLAGITSSLLFTLAVPVAVMAASTIVVTPTHEQGWLQADTNSGGDVNFVADNSAPGGGNGALQLTTEATTAAKAQYMHEANTPLADVAELSYYTKQNSASFAEGAPSYQVVANLNGTSGFTTLVFEPYQNPTQGAVVSNTWQQWDVDQGLFWSSRQVTCSATGQTVLGTPGGPATYTLADLNTLCPDAVVIGFGVNIGSSNPSYNVETDLVNFNGTAYDFELTNTPNSKDQCKKDGYKNLTDADGNAFKNQGACVSYSNKH
jgi:hypothetical protein